MLQFLQQTLKCLTLRDKKQKSEQKTRGNFASSRFNFFLKLKKIMKILILKNQYFWKSLQ